MLQQSVTKSSVVDAKVEPLEVVDLGTAQGKVLDYLKLKYGNKVNLTGVGAIDYIKSAAHLPLKAALKEKEIMYYLVRAKTAKEIAKIFC